MHKSWGKTFVLPALAGTISAAIVLVFVYRNDITTLLIEKASESNREYAKQFVGESVSSDVLVKISGHDEAVPIKNILEDSALVIAYREGCPPCRSAVNHYLALRQGRSDYGESLFVLSTDSDQNPPAGFPKDRFMVIKESPSDYMFKGRSTPRIYRYSKGVLSDFMIGYQDQLLDRWLTTAYGD